jgi:uncharacterized protein
MSEQDLKAAPDGRLASLMKAAAGGKGPAPVEKWNPEFCGDLEMVIGADGTWHYQGSPIGRQALVKLFASVLRKDEDGRTYLVTPVEKVGITVEDAHFLAVEIAREGEGRTQVLAFRTNVDEWVAAGPEHPIRFEEGPPDEAGEKGLKPYIAVRGRLEALATRALVYDLVDLMSEEEGRMGIWSGGVFHRADIGAGDGSADKGAVS